jgi:GalNAc-alpha-(1->4)-GalNAc-alpha-(1->3)-diNAcBac-PP-undecaprenol alpha-1,4-N-acetyl-D-galactosaminyltransferase
VRRVLLLNTDLEIGGTPTVVRELAIRLTRAGGVVVEVACLSKWGPVADQLRDAGVTVHAFDAHGARDLPSTVRKLGLLSRQRRYDTVLSFLVHANVVAAMTSRTLRDVRFLQSIQTTQPNPRWHWFAQSAAQLAAEKVVVPSESVATIARERAHVPNDKIVVIPNAIDPADWTHAVAPLLGSTITIGFVGRLDPVKRVPLLVDAFSRINRPSRLEIYGDGPDRAAIQARVDELGLGDRVTLHGTLSRPRQAMAGFHVLALPSVAEGFGLVLIEAMAAGVPVVAADAPGIRDVVRSGENGLLVDPTNRAAFAAALAKASIVYRNRFVEAGFRTVRERYAWTAILPQYQRLLDVK